MRTIILAAISFALGLLSWATDAAAAVTPGDFLLASADGVSVFNREGSLKFGRFATTLKDGRPGVVEWSDMIYDGCRLPSGNYLCASHHYVRELAPDGKTIWEFRVAAPAELKTCVPLPNGDVMTVDAERMEMVQLTDAGRRVARRIPVPTKREADPHSRYNLLRRTPVGTYLLALRFEKAFVEVDDNGKELWRHSVPDLPVVAERLANGNTLMSWRGGLIEATPNHEIVWELKAADLTEFPVIIFGGFHRFPNGNTLIVNSDWHYQNVQENRVQVFEVSTAKKVVWKLGVESFAGTKPGSLEPTTGLIEHRLIGLQWLGAKTSPAKIK